MKYWPVSLFFEAAEGVIGRAFLFVAVGLLAAFVGVSISAGEIVFSAQIFAYMGMAMLAVFSDAVYALLSLGLMVCFFVYLRCDIKHWFLIPVFVLGGCHAYFLYDLYAG